VATFHNYTTK